MMVPFVRRHIALADPEVLILMGNTPCARPARAHAAS